MDESRAQRRLNLSITAEHEGQRLDTLLRTRLGLSTGVIRRAKGVAEGILLDGRPVYTNVRPKAGQLLSIRLDDDKNGDIPPAEGPLELLYEDDDIMILNKAAGIPVHPSQGHHGDTLGNFLAAHFERQSIPFVFRPVNRLDRGTSGLMVVARHAHAQEVLKGQLHSGGFLRRYLAICDGAPPSAAGTIDAPIGRADGSVLKREIRADGAAARTHYKTLKTTAEGRTLLQLELETGRTHQIRVHMAYLGCPLTGDFLYGTEQPDIIGRAALHSSQLELVHPITGERIQKTAPLPFDMARLLEETGERKP